MKRITLFIGIISVVMIISLAAHAPTARHLNSVVEAKNNISSDTELLLSDQVDLLNLFTLSGSDTQFSVRKPTTRIPGRPVVRSPFQPSW